MCINVIILVAPAIASNYIEQVQVQIVIFSQTEYGIFMTGQKNNFSEKSSHCKPDRYSSVKHVSKCAFHIVVQINATVSRGNVSTRSSCSEGSSADALCTGVRTILPCFFTSSPMTSIFVSRRARTRKIS